MTQSVVTTAVLARASSAPSAVLLSGDQVQPTCVDWLWRGWIASGKMHILGGQPGTGKTTIAMSLIATITSGGTWPDGSRAEAGSVVIWSGEDDPSDTLAPRLVAEGADMSKVNFITGKTDKGKFTSFNPAADIEALANAMTKIPDVRLIVIDPIVSAVSGDSHKGAEVRRGLQPLVDLAQTKRCALLGITHLSKGTAGREPIERITGSLAFGALARVVLIAAKRDAGDAVRFLARAKSNIGPDEGGFSYEINQAELEEHPGVVACSVRWIEALEGSARDLLQRSEAPTDDEANVAVRFLHDALAQGPLLLQDIRHEAQLAGIAWRTVQRAMKRAGVQSIRRGFGSPATWQLADFTHPRQLCHSVEGGADGVDGQETTESRTMIC